MFGLQFINSQNYSPSYNFAPGYRNPHKISESLFAMTSLSNIHISIWRANKIWRALSNWKIQFHVIGQYLFRITWYSLQLLRIKARRERGVGNWPHWLYISNYSLILFTRNGWRCCLFIRPFSQNTVQFILRTLSTHRLITITPFARSVFFFLSLLFSLRVVALTCIFDGWR